MPNLYNAACYKNKIIHLLLNNKDFIKLINPVPNTCKAIDIIDVLLGGEWIINGEKYKEQGHIFDYNFIDDTTKEEKTFVFVETDIDSVKNHIFTNFNLYICIFTSKNLVRINNNTIPTLEEIKKMGYFASNYANRIDILCDIVDRILNGTGKIEGIGDVQPANRGYVSLYIPSNNKYYGKILKYNISNYNDGGEQCGN